MTATRLAAHIREGRLSAAAVLEAHLAHIAVHNPALNAIVTLDPQRARARAAAADRAIARGELWGPLHGVPFTLKDSHATAGMRTTAGFLPLADYVPSQDGTIAGRLKTAGAILMGKTNVSVLLADIQSHNPIFGRSNNPWRLERTCGGSSGGAAAAVASGMSPFDVGSDIGGSIRIPAHFCGVFGLKATENRVSHAGHIPGLPGEPRAVRIMASAGPIARSIADLSLLFRLVAGPDGQDVEVPPVTLEEHPPLQVTELRVAVAPTFPGFPVSAEIAAAIRHLARELQPHCAVVAEALPAQDFQEQLVRARQLTDAITSAFQPPENDPPLSLPQYLRALHKRDQAIIAWEQFFDEWDVLLCPASCGVAFAHCETGAPLQVDGKQVDYWWANAHCKIFNYSGHPAIVLPYGLSTGGLPIGLQLVTRRWGETRLLAIAAALAPFAGVYRRPPGY